MILDVGGGRASERANASPELASSISPSNGQQYRYGQKFLDYIAKKVIFWTIGYHAVVSLTNAIRALCLGGMKP
jgi:hypothetical protein